FTSYLQLEKHCSPHTVVAYGRDLREFSAFCREQHGLDTIDDVGYGLIRNWIVALSGKGLGNRSINRKLSSLSAYYRFLLKVGQCSVSPMAGHRALKTEKRMEL